MTFAEDYAKFTVWQLSRSNSPEAFEEDRALHKDADYYRENKNDIEEALLCFYWIVDYLAPLIAHDEPVDAEQFGRVLWAVLSGRLTDYVANLES